MKFVLHTALHLVALTLIESGANLGVTKCLFPQFMRRNTPWVGDYKDKHTVVYVKLGILTIREQNFVPFTRNCQQKTPENKFLVEHTEGEEKKLYLCMQFLHRGENVVQIKTSDLYPKQTLDICDESKMAIDPYPLVSSEHTLESRISCPFTGGYNMYVFHPHPNNSIICNNLMLLMRMESECDRGEGITFDFRRESCVPKQLPRNQTQRAHCVAHWTQGIYTFILLQHATVAGQWFCLRTADPLSNIRSAYLWTKVICDTSERPSHDISNQYLRLELTKRIFSSTCADELELCQEITHYCSSELRRHCAHTCGQCMSENQIGECTFDEQYRGRWVESNNNSDNIFDVEVYTLHSAQLGKYDCLDLDSNVMPEKKVLLELYTNGCFPRYACIEMAKVTSSVMKFRLGDRLTWPLSDTKKQKEEICNAEHFRVHDQRSHYFKMEKPARLLVNVENIREVNCGLPKRLQNGIAFREDGKHCGGCLTYDRHLSPNHFTVSPVNCSIESNEQKGYRNMPIQYSCLATFQFYNNTYSVVTKTTTFATGIGQYLVWIFTPEKHIKVMKAADTYLFEFSSHIESSIVQAQFSILRNDNLQCRNFVFLPRSTTTTTRTTPRRFPGLNNNHDNESEFYITGTTFHGIDPLTYNPGNGKNVYPEVKPHTNTPRYENSKGDKMMDNNSRCRHSSSYLDSLLCFVLVAIVTDLLLRTDHVTFKHNIT